MTATFKISGNGSLRVTSKNKASQPQANELMRIKLLYEKLGLEAADDYKVRLHNCWNCHLQILVFDWSRPKKFAVEHPPAPRPRSVCYSKTIRKTYWANRCQFCDEVQDDQAIFWGPSPYEWHDVNLLNETSVS
jgi:hypothetical protein